MGEVPSSAKPWIAAAVASAGTRSGVEGRVYDELRDLARRLLARGPGVPSVGPTELVHEAWARLARRDSLEDRERAPFLAMAARAMRDILVDRARARGALKRGGGAAAGELDSRIAAAGDVAEAERVLDVHAALEALERESPLHAKLVELRWFGGLTAAEAAECLALSEDAQKKAWAFARRWLWVRLKTLGSVHGASFGS